MGLGSVFGPDSREREEGMSNEYWDYVAEQIGYLVDAVEGEQEPDALAAKHIVLEALPLIRQLAAASQPVERVEWTSTAYKPPSVNDMVLAIVDSELLWHCLPEEMPYWAILPASVARTLPAQEEEPPV